MFRVNRAGEFNVPVGAHANPRIVDEAHLRQVAAASAAAASPSPKDSFEGALLDAGKGDFIYCDPPYAPVSRTSCFANYTATGFTLKDQKRLQQALIGAATAGRTSSCPIPLRRTSWSSTRQTRYAAPSCDRTRRCAARDQLAWRLPRTDHRACDNKRPASGNVKAYAPAIQISLRRPDRRMPGEGRTRKRRSRPRRAGTCGQTARSLISTLSILSGRPVADPERPQARSDAGQTAGFRPDTLPHEQTVKEIGAEFVKPGLA